MNRAFATIEQQAKLHREDLKLAARDIKEAYRAQVDLLLAQLARERAAQERQAALAANEKAARNKFRQALLRIGMSLPPGGEDCMMDGSC